MTGWFETNRGALGHREPAFAFLRDNLPKAPVIVETGSLRSPGNVNGDGNATMFFDELTAAAGRVISIDLNADCGSNIEYHCGSQVEFMQGDSLDVLRMLTGKLKNIDLLYLDSLDVDFEHDELAARHALKECQYAMHMLSRKALIAVDDNDGFGRGKGRLVEQFAELKQWPLLLDGYVKVWSCDGSR
jgi:hypothetical protein